MHVKGRKPILVEVIYHYDTSQRQAGMAKNDVLDNWMQTGRRLNKGTYIRCGAKHFFLFASVLISKWIVIFFVQLS